jgi:spermidine synthase
MPRQDQSTKQIILLYCCYFLIGFALLSLEVIWGRLSSLTLGSSIRAYSITLAAVMAGLFFGTFHGNRVSASAEMKRLFSYMIGFALLAGVASISLVYLPEFFKFWRFALPLSAKAAYYVTLVQVSVLVFLPAFFAGAVFPIAIQILVPDVDHAGRTAGFLYMMNSMGAITGCLLTGFFLIEHIGLKNSAILISILPAIPALLFFLYYRSAVQATAVLLAMLLLTTGGVIAAYPQSPFTVYVSQRYGSLQEFNRSSQSLETLGEYENSHGIVRVIQSDRLRFLQVNSKTESSFMGRDLPTQALLALLPRVYLQRNPEHVLDIGLGTGTTVWFAQKWAGEIDSVEINPDVYAAVSDFFFPEFKQAENINFIFQEARFYLGNTDKKYHVMTVEPSYPTDSVTASLYTRESFLLYRQALSRDGILSLFIPLHVIGTRHAEGVIKTLLTAFDYVQIWNISNGSDIVVVASQQPFNLTPDEVVSKIGEYKIQQLGDLSAELTYARRNSMLEHIRQSPDIPIYSDDVITLELAAIDGFLTEHEQSPR